MAKRIWVPLDRSSAAESVLEVVADAAEGAGGNMCLMTAEPQPDTLVGPPGRVVAYADQGMERLEPEGLDYLPSAVAI